MPVGLWGWLCVCSRRQIQEILVSIGDRQPSFIGSSDWIGAVELGYIMDEYLGITCKVGGGAGTGRE